MSDILEEGAQTSVTQVAGIENLVLSARQAFQLVEPWCQAKPISENETVKHVIIEIKQSFAIYLDAIDMSIQTSDAGVTIAEDAVFLCDSLAKDMPKKNLIIFIDEIIDNAKEAHEKAQQTILKFRSARQGLLQITSNMGHYLTRIEQDISYAVKNGRKFRQLAGLADFVAKSALSVGALISATGVGTASPILAFVLPIILDMVALAAQSSAERLRSKSKERATEELTSKDAISRMNEINSTLNSLVDHITKFADWWLEVVSDLINIKHSVAQSSFSKLAMAHVSPIREKWHAVANQYRLYVREITKLQDFYPGIPRGKVATRSIEFLTVNICSRQDELSPETKIGDFSINLASTITSLAQHVDKCQVSFRDIHNVSAYVKKSHYPQFREDLDDIRVHIISEWRDISPYLHAVISFGNDIRVCPPDNYDEIWTIAAKVIGMAQKLINSNSTSREKFIARKESIIKRLPYEGSLPHKPTTPGSDDEILRPYNSHRMSHSYRGLDAMIALEHSQENIGSCLDDLISFWNNGRAVFHTFGQEIHQGADATLIKYSWSADQDRIKSSIKSIEMSHDLLLATGAVSPFILNTHRRR